MPVLRTVGAFGAAVLLHLNFTTCRSPGDAGKGPGAETAPNVDVTLEGVDTGDLTAREKKEWSKYVTELLAPCPNEPVSLAQCVKEKRKCDTCLPAAKLLLKQVTRGKTRNQAEAAFRIRFAPDQVKNIELRDSPAKGAKDAPVVLVEWADFECPFCAAASPQLDKYLKMYDGSLKIVFKHYPLSIHKHAEYAARASVAAGRQGKFWEMHHQLFGNQEALDKPALIVHAGKLGLDIKQFKTDLDAEEVADVVARDRKDAEKLDLEGTPMIYINGRYFNLDYFDILEDMPEWIELEAELRTGKRPKPKPIKEAPKKEKEVAAPGPSAAPPASASASPK